MTRFASTGPIYRAFRVDTFWPIIISLLHTRGGRCVVLYKTLARRERATIELHGAGLLAVVHATTKRRRRVTVWVTSTALVKCDEMEKLASFIMNA